MVFKRLRKSLANNNGAATPMILVVILSVIIGFAVLFTYLYKCATVDTIHDSCQSVVEQALLANAESSYQAKRDGYAGIWHLDSEGISDSTVYIDPSARLAEQLNLVSEAGSLVKMDGDKQVYRLRDIELTIQNPEFQSNSTLLTATLSLNIDLVLDFPLVEKLPITIPIKVSAAWNPKF